MRVLEQERRTALRAVPAAVRQILFLTDLAPRARAAFSHAAMLAERFGATLTVFHAVAGPDDDAEWSPAKEVARRAALEARDRLGMDTGTLRTPAEVVVVRGMDVRASVRARLEHDAADLVVLATHGRAGLSVLNPRSLSDLVLQEARCPVLCVREPEHGAPVGYQRILVPTDLSEDSRRALPLARLLADAFSAEVIGLHVARDPAVSTLSGIPDLVEEMPGEAQVAAFLASELDGTRWRVVVRAGSPSHGIVETAAAEHADLVVSSTHGHDSLSDRLLGSHAERLVRESPCPVVLV